MTWRKRASIFHLTLSREEKLVVFLDYQLPFLIVLIVKVTFCSPSLVGLCVYVCFCWSKIHYVTNDGLELLVLWPLLSGARSNRHHRVQFCGAVSACCPGLCPSPALWLYFPFFCSTKDIKRKARGWLLRAPSDLGFSQNSHVKIIGPPGWLLTTHVKTACSLTRGFLTFSHSAPFCLKMPYLMPRI